MTSTLTPPAVREKAAPAAGSTAGSRKGAPAAKQRGGTRGFSWRGLFLGGVGVIVVMLVVPLFSTSTLSPDNVKVFEVSRRDFSVLLREKGELKAAKSIDVKCEVEGKSTIKTLIDEGTEVKEGDLLVRLASDQIDERVQSEEIKEANAAAGVATAVSELEILLDQNQSDIRQAQLALDMAVLELEKYVKGDWEQTKLDMELELDRAKKVLERAESDLEASKELYAQKFIPKGDLVDDEIEHFRATIDVEKARLRKETEEKYTHPKEMQRLQSDVDEARKELERVKKSGEAKQAKAEAELAAKRAELELTRAKLSRLKQQQALCEIRAPQAGLVVYDTGAGRWDRRQIAEGSEAYEGQTLIKLPDPSVMMVQVRIHEAKTDRIALGQSVNVEVEGIPGRVFTGKVTKIAVLADSQNQWLNPDLKEYETEITLDPTDAPLKPGVTARADIIVRELDDVLAVPVPAVFSKAGHHFVFVGNPDDAEPVEVSPGSSSDEFVEITSGVDAGDRVLLAVSEQLRRKLPELEAQSHEGPPGAAGEPRPAKGKTKGGPRKRVHSKAKSNEHAATNAQKDAEEPVAQAEQDADDETPSEDATSDEQVDPADAVAKSDTTIPVAKSDTTRGTN